MIERLDRQPRCRGCPDCNPFLPERVALEQRILGSRLEVPTYRRYRGRDK